MYGRWGKALLAFILGVRLLEPFSASEVPSIFHSGLCSSVMGNINDWKEIFQYLNSISEKGELICDAHKDIRGCAGRTCREHFKLVSYMTEDIYEYGTYASAYMLWYSGLRNYSMSIYNFESIQALKLLASEVSTHQHHSLPQLRNNLLLKDDQRWQKIWILHEKVRNSLMETKDLKDITEYVVWVDSDVIVLDPNLRLERFCRSFPYSDVVVSRDFKAEHGLINSGLMILRVSHWTLQFLEAWWNFGHEKVSDQGAFGRMWATNQLSLRKHVTLLDPEVLNTRFPAWFNLLSGHKVLHLAGVHNEVRVAVFREALRKVCSTGTRGIEQVRQIINRQDILLLLGQKRRGIISNVINEAIQKEGAREFMGEFREGLQKALQLGFACREQQQKLEASELLDTSDESVFRNTTKDCDEEIEVATIALWWASAQLDPSRFRAPSDDDCTNSSTIKKCTLEQSEIGQIFLESHFELLDHLRFIPKHLRKSPVTSSPSRDKPSSDLLHAAHLLADMLPSRGHIDNYLSLVLFSLESCREQLNDLHGRLLVLKPLMPPSARDASLQRLLYYSYKLFDLRASILGEWGCPTRVHKDSLITATQILCALGHSHVGAGSEGNMLNLSLSSLLGLFDDAKEEAASIILSIISVPDAPFIEGCDEVEEHYRHINTAFEVFWDHVEVMWHLDSKQVKAEMENEKTNLAALAYNLLDQVWGDRVRPKHIETTARLLEEEMRKYATTHSQYLP